VNTRYDRTGLILFLVYLVFYGGFVLIAAWKPEAMDATPFGGINLAIWYGFGLIAAAFLLAMIYGSMTIKEHKSDEQDSDSAGQS